MEISDKNFDELTLILEKEYQSLSNIKILLEQEKVALEKSDTLAVETITHKKQYLLDAINLLEKDRENLVGKVGLKNDKGIMEKIIASSPKRTYKIHGYWHRILEILATCDKQNQVNGNLIQCGQFQVQRVVELLFGHDEKDIYDASARKHSTYSSTKIDQA